MKTNPNGSFTTGETFELDGILCTIQKSYIESDNTRPGAEFTYLCRDAHSETFLISHDDLVEYKPN